MLNSEFFVVEAGEDEYTGVNNFFNTTNNTVNNTAEPFVKMDATNGATFAINKSTFDTRKLASKYNIDLVAQTEGSQTEMAVGEDITSLTDNEDNEWLIASSVATGKVNLTAEFTPKSDFSLTAKLNSTALTAQQIQALDFRYVSGATSNGTPTPAYTGTYGTDIVFTFNTNDPNNVFGNVTYTVEQGVQKQIITPVNGNYTVPGSSVYGNVTIDITSKPVENITVTAID